MTRQEFLTRLRNKLSILSPEEQRDAVQFYEEYFEEAGPENEQAILAELGSPDLLAEKIISGEGKVILKGRKKPEREQKKTNFYAGTFSSYYTKSPQAPQPPKTKLNEWQHFDSYRYKSCPRHRIWPWILLLVTSPIWVSLLIGLIGCIIGLAAVIVSLFIAAIALTVGLVVLTVFCFGLSLYLIPRDPLNGLYIFSISLMGLGGTLITIPLAMLCIRKGFPAIGHGISRFVSWCGQLFTKKHRQTAAQEERGI